MYKLFTKHYISTFDNVTSSSLKTVFDIKNRIRLHIIDQVIRCFFELWHSAHRGSFNARAAYPLYSTVDNMKKEAI